MGILGESGYGYLLRHHMCCGFPSAPRGSTLPRKCICPPTVHLQQTAFSCKEGNELDCVKDKGVNIGGSVSKPLDDPLNMYGANFSFTSKVYRQNPKIWYRVFGGHSGDYNLISLQSEPMKLKLKQHIKEELNKQCGHYSRPDYYSFCKPTNRTS